jgi:general secretion pathway protein D
MTSDIKHHARTFILSVATAALLAPSVHADCTYELFNIASVKGTTVGEFIDQISDECGMSIIVAGPEAENILKKPMNKTFLKNLTINEVLDLIIKENDLQYTLQNNVLKITYLTTKTYNLDYITSERKGEGSTDITLSSQAGSPASTTGAATVATAAGGKTGSNSSRSQSGMKITSTDEVQFWETLNTEIENILNRPEDGYKADVPTINKNAGLLTVTATGKQIKRLDDYIIDLQKKMQTQVLIDVKMYSVIFKDGSSTGIDWSQLYALQNINLSFDSAITSGVAHDFVSTTSTATTTAPLFGTFNAASNNASVFQLGAKGSLNEVIKFLKTQGDVYSISNPKVLTLNNQPALITAGTELFYKITSSTSTTTTTTTTAQNETVNSVFSGVLLDITPEISNDGTITLRINPSVSETASTVSTDNSLRKMPPDLNRRQLSSVVTVKDGSRIILGGLINTKTVNDSNKVPLLGDIPFLGYLFKREAMTKQVEELVIIIEPHIVKKEADTLSLGDLGYKRLGNKIDQEAKQETK